MKRGDEVLIIGAGLAGIFAALRLESARVPYVLVNSPHDATNSGLGGFAAFSGAKFSLLPAGEGLSVVAGGKQALERVIAEVLRILSLPESSLKKSQSTSLVDSTEKAKQENLWLKSYDSYVLSPDQIDQLLARLTDRLRAPSIFKSSECLSLSVKDGTWSVEVRDSTSRQTRTISAKAIIYAGGRSNSRLVKEAGVSPTDGKGLDVGLRIEFKEKEGLDALRALGPDAKVLRKPVRTFCLNHPGRIYYYEYQNILLPGGVVEVDNFPAANIAILNRVEDKAQALKKCLTAMDALGKQSIKFPYASTEAMLRDPLLRGTLSRLFGTLISDNVLEFINSLLKLDLIRCTSEQVVHLPLLDWHWDVFGPETSFEAAPGLFVVGDASGKARGLLQACVSGWLGGQECATSLK